MDARQTLQYVQLRKNLNMKNFEIKLNDFDGKIIELDFLLCPHIENLALEFNKKDLKKLIIKNAPENIFKIEIRKNKLGLTSLKKMNKHIDIIIKGTNTQRITFSDANIQNIKLDTPNLINLFLTNNPLKKIDMNFNISNMILLNLGKEYVFNEKNKIYNFLKSKGDNPQLIQESALIKDLF